jgi:hypothetical protein
MDTCFAFDIVHVQVGRVDITLRDCWVDVGASGLCVIKAGSGNGIRVTHISNIVGIVLPGPERKPETAVDGGYNDDQVPF